jgi:hypothetical protein
VAERFPGGINQFAQLLAQLPPEAIEDLMIHAADGADIGLGIAPDRGMPGDIGMNEVEVQWVDREEGANGGGGRDGGGDEDDSDDEQTPAVSSQYRFGKHNTDADFGSLGQLCGNFTRADKSGMGPWR